MSSHIGISCDSCLKTNFSNRRYKCLICDNYDLCGSCYDLNSQSENHLNTHAMQCLLTKTDYDLFYAGESISYQTIVSLTCPYCSQSGFILSTLQKHCLEQHSTLSNDDKINENVICPVCVINSSEERSSRFVSFIEHITKEHVDMNFHEFDERKEYFDDENDDDDDDDDDDDIAENEGFPLYILAEKLFLKEDARRQELTRQKLAQTILRNNNFISQKYSHSCRPIIRSTRGKRHFNQYPYGSSMNRTNFDTKILSEPYSTMIFDFDPTQFSIPSNRLITFESINNERINQKKSIISNIKERFSSHMMSNSLKIPEQKVNSDMKLIQDESFGYFHTINDHKVRSLLEKILKTIDKQTTKEKPFDENRLAFLESLFFSLMNTNSINREQI